MKTLQALRPSRTDRPSIQSDVASSLMFRRLSHLKLWALKFCADCFVRPGVGKVFEDGSETKYFGLFGLREPRGPAKIKDIYTIRKQHPHKVYRHHK